MQHALDKPKTAKNLVGKPSAKSWDTWS